MLSLYQALGNGLIADVNGLAPWAVDGFNVFMAAMAAARKNADAHAELEKRLGII